MRKIRIDILRMRPGIMMGKDDYDSVMVDYLADGVEYTFLTNVKLLKTSNKLFLELKAFSIHEKKRIEQKRNKKLNFHEYAFKIINTPTRMV